MLDVSYLRLWFLPGTMNNGSGVFPSSPQQPVAGGEQHVEPGLQQVPPSQHSAAPGQHLQQQRIFSVSWLHFSDHVFCA